MNEIKKLVIPVAGYGTRFLPFTKSIPKEMLPIVDRPVIQYIVEEAVAAGIKDIVLITGYSKRAIEDYFDYNIELENLLEKSGKTAQKELIRQVSDIASFTYVRQKEQLGTGHALLQLKHLLGNEPFIMVSGDDLYAGTPSRIQRLKDAYEKYNCPALITMERSAPSDYDRYGYLKVAAELEPGIMEVTDVIEHPGFANAPSSHASFIGYVLTPDIFPLLEKTKPRPKGEIYVTDAINDLAHQQKVIAVSGDGLHFHDCGDKLEYLKTVAEFALQREDVGAAFREHLKKLLAD